MWGKVRTTLEPHRNAQARVHRQGREDFFFNLEEIKAKANIIVLPVLTKLAAASLRGDTSRLLAVQF